MASNGCHVGCDARVSNGRVHRSMEGWSIIEKVTDFTHAVCRVADGRGTAILVAIPSYESTKALHSQPQTSHTQEKLGVLLTTSFVFPTREDTQDATVTFLEQPVAGTSARLGRAVPPVTAPVRVDKVFVCSTSRATPRWATRTAVPSMYTATGWGSGREFGMGKENPYSTVHTNGIHSGCGNGEPYETEEEEEEEELGYTLTMCDFNSLEETVQSYGSRTTSPCPRSASCSGVVSPIFTCFSPSENVLKSSGGTSGIGVHAGGTSRNTNVGSATTVSHGLGLPVKPLPLPLLLSRIAPVCVGDHHLMITHTNGKERHYVVQTVKKLGKDSCEYEFSDPSSEFSSGGPIFDLRGDFIGLQHQCGVRSYGIFISSIVRHLFQSNILGICRLPIADVRSEARGNFELRGSVPDEVFNQPFRINQRYCVLDVGAGDQLIEYEDFARLRLRDNIHGSARPSSLVEPESIAVWREFYTDFRSLILILHAFSHSPKVVRLAMEEMTNHEHRHHLTNVASLGGIGILLEVIDEYPHREEVVLAALTVLARTSLYDSNREAIYRCDGVLTILEIMSEYSHQPYIQEWGFCCLYNLMSSDSSVCAEATELFICTQGIAIAIEALRMHYNDRHVLRYASFTLACVMQRNALYVPDMVGAGIVEIIDSRMKEHRGDDFIFIGLATLLSELLKRIAMEEEEVELREEQEAKETLSPLLFPSALPKFERIRSANYTAATATMNSSSVGHSLFVGESNVASTYCAWGCEVLDNLVNTQLITVLCDVMTRAACERYSSAAVTLLEECITAVVLLLQSRLVELKEELGTVNLTEVCQTIMRSFPTEKLLMRQSTVVVRLLETLF